MDDKDRLLVPKPFEYPLIQYSAPRVELPLNNCYHSRSFIPFKEDEGGYNSEDDVCTHWLDQWFDEVCITRIT